MVQVRRQPIETAPKDGTDVLVFYEWAASDFCHIAWWSDGEYWQEMGYDCQADLIGWWSYCAPSTQEKLCGDREPTSWSHIPDMADAAA